LSVSPGVTAEPRAAETVLMLLSAGLGSAWLRKYAGCVSGAIGWTPWGAFLQERAEDHPMAHLRGPGIEVWLEAQLRRDRSLWIEQ